MPDKMHYICISFVLGLGLVTRFSITDHLLDNFPGTPWKPPFALILVSMKEDGASITDEDHVDSIAVKEDAAPTAAEDDDESIATKEAAAPIADEEDEEK